MAFVAAGAVASIATGNLTLSYPAGISTNDILVACITIRDTVGFSTPSGWTKIADTESLGGNTATSNGIASCQHFWRRHDGTGSSQVFSRTGGNLATGAIVAFSGRILTGDPVDVTSLSVASGTTLTPTGVTTTDNDADLIWANHLADNGTVSGQTGTTPSTWNERVDVGTNTGADGGININTAVMTTAGATSGITGTSSIAGTHARVLIALKREPPALTNDVRLRVGSAARIVTTALSVAASAPSLAMGLAFNAPSCTVSHSVTLPSFAMPMALGTVTGDTGAGPLTNDVLLRHGSAARIVTTAFTVSRPFTTAPVALTFNPPIASVNEVNLVFTIPPMALELAGSAFSTSHDVTPPSVPLASAYAPPTGLTGGESTATMPGYTLGLVFNPPLATVSHAVTPSVPPLGLLLNVPANTIGIGATLPSLAMAMEFNPPIASVGAQIVTVPSLAMGLTFAPPSASVAGDEPLLALRAAFVAPRRQRPLVDLRTDVRANLASQHLARLEEFVSCTYTRALDHSGTARLEVMPDASYLVYLKQGRVLRITDAQAKVFEYRIEQVTESLTAPTVTVIAKPVIHDLNRVFLWEAQGGIPIFAIGGEALTAAEWIDARVLPVLIAAGLNYVVRDIVDSTRTLDLTWQGQTVLWLLNQLIDGTDLDISYEILNPGDAVEVYGLSIMRVGAEAPSPLILVGENAHALDWTVDGQGQGNIIIAQGALPAGGIERTNIGEYTARVVSVEGNALTLEDPDGNPAPVYAQDQVTGLYLETLIPPIPGGALS